MEKFYYCEKCDKNYILPAHCIHYTPDSITKKLDQIIDLLESVNGNLIDIEDAINRN